MQILHRRQTQPMKFLLSGSSECWQVSLTTFLELTNSENRPVKVVVGVVILQKDKVLLLQRSAAERHFPNIWELPSAKVENDDATLLDAAARECLEETGMMVTEFVAEAKSFEYTIEGRGLTLQLNFIVEAEGNVGINQKEHQQHGWYTEGEVKQIEVTESTREVLTGAFEWHRRN